MGQEIISREVLYIILKLDDIVGVCEFSGVFAGITTAFAAFFWALSYSDPVVDASLKIRAAGKLLTISFIPISVLMLLTSALVPTTNQALIIWGVPEVVNNQRVQEIGDDMVTILENELDNLLGVEDE